jgi:hypothetical protein
MSQHASYRVLAKMLVKRLEVKGIMICALLFLVLGNGCSSDSNNTKDTGSTQDTTVVKESKVVSFLPADDAVKGYVKQQAPETAATNKELDDLIDGGSEKYKENKFYYMTQVYYLNTQKATSIKVWIFDQTDTAGAEGAFNRAKSPSGTAISPAIGEASLEDLTLPAGYTAILRKAKYVAQVVVDKKDSKDDGKALLTKIAEAIK